MESAGRLARSHFDVWANSQLSSSVDNSPSIMIRDVRTDSPRVEQLISRPIDTTV